MLGLSVRVYGQERFNLSTGVGFPEVLYLGASYQLRQTQIGVDFGWEPFRNVDWITMSVNGYYHFAGVSHFSNRRPWYGRIGLVYMKQTEEDFIDNYFDLLLRAGRDLNFSPRFGIALDAGIMIGEIGEIKGVWDSYFFLAPSLGITLFYRLKSN